VNSEGEPYVIVTAPRVRRDLQRLPESVAAACIEFIQAAIATTPRRVGKPLLGPFVGCFAARRGSYRIIYRIDDESRTVQIVYVDHRSDVYRRP